MSSSSDDPDPTYDDAEATLGHRRKKKRKKSLDDAAPVDRWWTRRPVVIVAGGLALFSVFILGLAFLVKAWLWPFEELHEPSEIVRLQQEIVEIELPDTFKPASGFRGRRYLKGLNLCTYERTGGGSLMVICFKGKPDSQEELNAFVDQQTGNSTEGITVEQSETRQILIEGVEQTVAFETRSFIDEAQVKRRDRDIHCFLDLGSHTVLVDITYPVDQADESEAIEILQSMQAVNTTP